MDTGRCRAEIAIEEYQNIRWSNENSCINLKLVEGIWRTSPSSKHANTLLLEKKITRNLI